MSANARPLTDEQRRLAEDNVALAYWALRQTARPGQRSGRDAGERESQALLTLVRCAKHFDPSRGWKFSTYYYRSVRSELHKLYCRDCAGGAAAQLAEQEYDNPALARVDAALAAVDESDRPDPLALVALAGADAKAVRWHYLDGLTFAAIGKRLGVSKQQAQNRVRRGLRAIRAALGVEL